jgi:hypothetical protein
MKTTEEMRTTTRARIKTLSSLKKSNSHMIVKTVSSGVAVLIFQLKSRERSERGLTHDDKDDLKD